MKNWCKLIKLDKHDIAVMRLSTTEEREHVQVIGRFPGGQFIKTASFDDQIESADKFFKDFNKKDAVKLVEELEKLLEKEDV